MQVKVTLTLKEEELKKIMDETGLTKPDEIKGYFYARERRNIDCEFGRRYDIDVKVDDTDDKLIQLGETLSGFFGICTEPPVVTPNEKPEVKEVKRIAEVGEWIKITDVIPYNGINYYEKGDILKVYKRENFIYHTGVYCELKNKCYPDGSFNPVADNGNLIIRDSEYVVLENYKPEVKEVKRAAKPGEWIKIVDAHITYGMYKDGDILKVDRRSGVGAGVIVTEFEFPGITGEEYVVLENYEPEDGEKK